MTPEILISIIGAITAISVSILGAYWANKNSIILQTRKLKEDHYINYIEALHNLPYNSNEAITQYTLARDKLFLVANENVIKSILMYEERGVGSKNHDKYLSDLIKEIRKDLKIKDKDFPHIYFKYHVQPTINNP